MVTQIDTAPCPFCHAQIRLDPPFGLAQKGLQVECPKCGRMLDAIPWSGSRREGHRLLPGGPQYAFKPAKGWDRELKRLGVIGPSVGLGVLPPGDVYVLETYNDPIEREFFLPKECLEFLAQHLPGYMAAGGHQPEDFTDVESVKPEPKKEAPRRADAKWGFEAKSVTEDE